MKTFLNLTNGLEVAALMPHDGYVRIQSTHLEQKLWSRVIEDLDYSFLLPVVSGEPVTVVDTSHREDGVSRAIYQGLPWIRACISARVLRCEQREIVKGHDCTSFFKWMAEHSLSPTAEGKLRYLRKFARPGTIINLSGMSNHTDRDGDYAYFVERYQVANDHHKHTCVKREAA